MTVAPALTRMTSPWNVTPSAAGNGKVTRRRRWRSRRSRPRARHAQVSAPVAATQSPCRRCRRDAKRRSGCVASEGARTRPLYRGGSREPRVGRRFGLGRHRDASRGAVAPPARPGPRDRVGFEERMVTRGYGGAHLHACVAADRCQLAQPVEAHIVGEIEAEDVDAVSLRLRGRCPGGSAAGLGTRSRRADRCCQREPPRVLLGTRVAHAVLRSEGGFPPRWQARALHTPCALLS